MTKFDIVALAAKQPNVRSHKEAIRNLLLMSGGELYKEVEVYLTQPGVTGRSQFDQAMVANAVKVFAGSIAGTNVDGAIVAELTQADIWRHIPSILTKLGMDVRRGKIVGLLEDLSGAPAEVVEDEAEEEVIPTQAAQPTQPTQPYIQ
jgi:hypothetical protein